MKHVSEGMLRRMLDEPEEMSEQDREHLETCAECKQVNGAIMEDVEVLTSMFGPQVDGLDAQGALRKLLAAEGRTFAEPEVPAAAVKEAKGKKPNGRRVAAPEPVTGGYKGLLFVGRVFVAFGTFVMLFVGYQLIGTNYITNQEQKDLAAAFESGFTSSVVDEAPDLGEGMARIQIPKIDVDLVVVEGVEVADLKKGPGHMPRTALPGQLGNMVISGHRTTYGAPFNRLDELKAGDPIVIYGRGGDPFQYRVTELRIVAPTAVEVAAPTRDGGRLTLTTCHPKFSAAQRLIVFAELQGTPRGIAQNLLDQGGGVEVLPEA